MAEPEASAGHDPAPHPEGPAIASGNATQVPGRIFLSYATQDAEAAKKVCAALEGSGQRCWIAPRDVQAGESYAVAIVEAINSCRMLVLMFSSNAIGSPHVMREVERATSKRRSVLTIRLDDSALPPELEYFLSAHQWLDGSGSRVDAILPALVAAVRGQHTEPHVPATAGAIRPGSGSPSGRSVNRYLIVLVAVVVLGGGYLLRQNFWHDNPVQATPRPASDAAAATIATLAPRTAVAVLPFANLTGDATRDYLGDGMAEELINTLGKVEGLKVPTRTSTFAYKGRAVDTRQIAKDLGVGSILEGSVRSAGDRIRIAVQLSDAQQGFRVWSETYDRKFTDLFKLQDDLAAAIVQALQVNLRGAAPASVAQAPPTQDVAAYQLYLQASSLIDRNTSQTYGRAIELLSQAVTRDPKFARAFGSLANAHMLLYARGQQAEHLALADKFARRALALDPDTPLAQIVLAQLSAYSGQWLEMETRDRAALALASADAISFVRHALNLTGTGKLRAANEAAQRAYDLAPANARAAAALASALDVQGREAEAMKFANLAVALGLPNYDTFLVTTYARAARNAGEYGKAAELHTANFADYDIDVKGRQAIVEAVRLVHMALADSRQRAPALAALNGVYPALQTAAASAVVLVRQCMQGARWFVMLNAVDDAYAMAMRCTDLGKGAAVGAAAQNSIGDLWGPDMRPFRRDPRFQTFATRTGLMEYWQKFGPPDDCYLADGKLTCH